MRRHRSRVALVFLALILAQGCDPAAPPFDPPEAEIPIDLDPTETETPDAASDDAVAPPRPDGGTEARVVRVVDGDTIRVLLEGRETRVRLIGIDTPELAREGRPDECFAREATEFTTRHLANQRVLLEFDVERLDRHGRTLAYVWLGDRLFNESLVARGFALVTTFPPNVKHVGRFVAAQERARREGRGLWSACR